MSTDAYLATQLNALRAKVVECMSEMTCCDDPARLDALRRLLAALREEIQALEGPFEIEQQGIA